MGDEARETAEEYYRGERSSFERFGELIERLESLGIPREIALELRRTRQGFSDVLRDAEAAYDGILKLSEARAIAAAPGDSRSKLADILIAIGAPTPAKTRNRQILEWWYDISRLENEHHAVLPDPLDLALPEYALKPGFFYACGEIHLGFDATMLDQFSALAKALGLSDEALLQRLEREALAASEINDPLGEVWIPKLTAILSPAPSLRDRLPPAILERITSRLDDS